ncbi:LysR substrate-binding domain-containing protein [Pseudomonas sp. S 311-6]|uniref:LysR family transcriptional regulator n=1 Tax=Pseudomonas TaxID=286 RepID=UPI001CE3DB24|nr:MULTISPECIES: LysR family transcriptional regulator [Pseudomonas]MCO7637633.1 LysR substrate-binding domain-containing protein [Pseudomonas sp. S 311-6]MCO7564956.1 LysR substrate-binding domain-containing protein [Pseudomonas mosselii]MCO7594950.1 LysR substrate-binding domain-containing protein [Pseudomonas guariconensis]MCO7616594.1 LysR substrate-binding domain-containing protein [Pseudomonas guariconensis]MCO7633551.1 LysR substrate-binding domain-containing protein [Pseudomonas guaric
MLPELKIAQLRYFLWVAELKSFHAAARQAYRTQPAVSLAVRELEQKLGQALVEKGGGRVELTPFGEHCLPLFRGLVEHHDRIAREATLLARHEIGQVSIATVPSVASRLLPGPLGRFVAEHPNVQVSIQDGSADSVQQLLAQGQVDFVISSMWMADEQVEFVPILNDQVGVVCRSDHPLVQGGGTLHWSQLQGVPIIRNGTSRLLEGTEAECLLAHSRLFVSNMISLIAMLEEGVGISTLPYLAFPLENEKLAFLPLAEPKVERQIGMLTRKGRSLSPAAEALMTFLRAQLPKAGDR